MWDVLCGMLQVLIRYRCWRKILTERRASSITASVTWTMEGATSQRNLSADRSRNLFHTIQVSGFADRLLGGATPEETLNNSICIPGLNFSQLNILWCFLLGKSLVWSWKQNSSRTESTPRDLVVCQRWPWHFEGFVGSWISQVSILKQVSLVQFFSVHLWCLQGSPTAFAADW